MTLIAQRPHMKNGVLAKMTQMRLISLAAYLAIGAILHLLFIGPHFDWTSAWTLAWLFGWPIMLATGVIGAVVGLGCLVMALLGFILTVGWLFDRRTWR